VLDIKWKNLSDFTTNLMFFIEMGSRLPHIPYTVQYLIQELQKVDGHFLEHKNLRTHIKTCVAEYHI